MSATPTTTARRPAPSLQPEIWAQIISYLHPPRPKDQNFFPNRHSRIELHQHDLAQCMRVSTTFYRLTAPILYHSPSINDPELFLHGLSLSTDPTSSSTSVLANRLAVQNTKLDLLSLAVALHLVDGGSPVVPRISTLVRNDLDDDAHPFHKDQRYHRKILKSPFLVGQVAAASAAAAALQHAPVSSTAEIFPRLRRVSVGKPTSRFWYMVRENLPPELWESAVRESRRLPRLLLSVRRLDVWCQHMFAGPLVPATPHPRLPGRAHLGARPAQDGSLPPKMVCMHLETPGEIPWVALGTTNRYYLSSRDFSGDCDKVMLLVRSVMRGFIIRAEEHDIAEDNELEQTTKLEIYLDPECLRKSPAELAEFTASLATTFETLPESNYDEPWRARDELRKAAAEAWQARKYAELREGVVRAVPERWQGRVKMAEWGEEAVCEACGVSSHLLKQRSL